VKKIFPVFLIFCIIAINGFAFSSKDTEVIKTVESIKYLSQKIANDYIYYCHNNKRVKLKDTLESSIKLLESDFRLVAKSTSNTDIKNILDYLSYSKDEIKDLLKKDVKAENIDSMLDYSESLYEGSNSILDSQNYASKDMKVHLMRISKIYMAFHTGNNTASLSELLQDEIKIVDMKFRSNSSWQSLKDILEFKNIFIPNVVTILVNNLEMHTI
jgi:hypothetical protein